eukprot:1019347-Ditylum_brightwellii.AAC.1
MVNGKMTITSLRLVTLPDGPIIPSWLTIVLTCECCKRCCSGNDEDVVTFSIFGEGNKQCSKKKQGTYTMAVGDFLRGLYRQNALNAEMKGYELERPEAMNFINCQYAE